MISAKPCCSAAAAAALVFLAVFGVVSGKLDVNTEISKIQTHIRNMKPPPELIGSLLEQLQAHCKNQRKIDQVTLNNASICVEQYLNETQIADDVKKAAPEGKLDDVFRGICLKWPKIKHCLREFFVIIEDCWTKGDKVTKIMDESVKFLCGDDNDGGRIALFFAEGGMTCLEQHGDGVKRCMGEINVFQDNIPQDASEIKIPETLDINTDEICRTMEQMAACTSKELKKCNDTTPENLVTSLVFYSSKTIGCEIKSPTPTAKAGSMSSSSETFILAEWLLATVVAGILL